MYENSTLCTKWFVQQANATGSFIVHQANAAGAFIVHQGNVVEHFGSYEQQNGVHPQWLNGITKCCHDVVWNIAYQAYEYQTVFSQNFRWTRSINILLKPENCIHEQTYCNQWVISSYKGGWQMTVETIRTGDFSMYFHAKRRDHKHGQNIHQMHYHNYLNQVRHLISHQRPYGPCRYMAFHSIAHHFPFFMKDWTLKE